MFDHMPKILGVTCIGVGTGDPGGPGPLTFLERGPMLIACAPLTFRSFQILNFNWTPIQYSEMISQKHIKTRFLSVLSVLRLYHRLRGSASPVLTATHHSYGSLAWLSDFFFDLGSRGQTISTDFDAKWLKRRAFTQGCAFCSKNRNWSPGPLKGQNFANFWT